MCASCIPTVSQLLFRAGCQYSSNNLNPLPLRSALGFSCKAHFEENVKAMGSCHVSLSHCNIWKLPQNLHTGESPCTTYSQLTLHTHSQNQQPSTLRLTLRSRRSSSFWTTDDCKMPAYNLETVMASSVLHLWVTWPLLLTVFHKTQINECIHLLPRPQDFWFAQTLFTILNNVNPCLSLQSLLRLSGWIEMNKERMALGGDEKSAE